MTGRMPGAPALCGGSSARRQPAGEARAQPGGRGGAGSPAALPQPQGPGEAPGWGRWWQWR